MEGLCLLAGIAIILLAAGDFNAEWGEGHFKITYRRKRLSSEPEEDSTD